MKTKKKNRFLTFCFSMLPGAAEMYMGFMKTGVSLMSLFMLVIMVAIWMNQGSWCCDLVLRILSCQSPGSTCG